MRLVARTAAAFGAAAAIAVAAAGPASAHICFKTGNPNNGTRARPG